MDAKVGNTSYTRTQVLHGDHHVIATGELKADNGELDAGLVLCKDGNGDLVGLDEATADLTGDVDDSNKDYTLASTTVEIMPKSVHVSHDDQDVYDDGHGTLYGDGSGTVNYITGAVSVTLDTAPAAESGQPSIAYLNKPEGVLLEDVDTADDDAAPMAVHGVVRKDKLVDADGSSVTAAVIAFLKSIGIFAV